MPQFSLHSKYFWLLLVTITTFANSASAFADEKPTRAEFANSVLAALAKFSDITFAYDAENFRLIDKDKKGKKVNLANVYQEHLELKVSERADHIARIAKLFSKRDSNVPDDYDSAKPNLRPKIWSRFMLENAKLRQRLTGGASMDLPLYPLGEHLFISLVYDTDTSMRSVSNKDLKTWGVTYDEALKAATANLGKATKAYSRIGEHFHSSVSGDSYDSSRVLLDHVRNFKVKGDHISLVPSRDMLEVAGSDDPESLKMMFDLAGMQKLARPLSPLPLIWKKDKWIDWLPRKDHEIRPVFDALHLKFTGELYGQQKKLLQKVLEHEGEDIFVASFTAVQDPDTKVIRSFCVWSNGVDTLLPKTQLVVICAKQGEMTAIGEWDHVRKVVGDLIEVDDSVYPTRYRVKDFPSEAQLKEIGKIAI